jgi:hypothetical protein
MTAPVRPVEVDGTYCYRIGKSYRKKLTCTAVPVPSEAVEASAKRFEPSPEAATLYVVRRRWGDTANRVPVSVDDRPPVLTIPDSLVRVRLKPGRHQVVLDWDGRRQVKSLTVAAGDVLFVEVDGSVWAWGASYDWAEPDVTGARLKASKSKLIADLDLGLPLKL